MGTDGASPKELLYWALGSAIFALCGPSMIAGMTQAWQAGVATAAIVVCCVRSAILMGELFAQEMEGYKP